ncbi:DUF2163 domain-containing protein [Selenomonas sp. F0473]|uniref:DUF2163 domain-containing protein n=1 Tax=Selenomonas sp. F0473 TaxID=999423 RepID=UPI0025EC2B6A|nr:DUF2163 domain-containing protein [Selenomonas sp. F0473]
MKTASDRLKTLLLESQTYYMTDLYEIVLADGTLLHYTSCDIPLVVGGTAYAPLAVERDGTTQTNDISVDEMSLTIHTAPDRMLEGQTTIMQGIVAGRFADAELRLSRLFSPVPFDIMTNEIDADYALLWWVGRLNIESAGGTTIEATVASATELLNTKFPTHLYYPPCIYTLGDISCGVDLSKFRVNGKVTSGTRSAIQSDLTLADGYLTNGSMRFTSGKNAGVTRTIRTNSSGTISVVMPFYYAPEPGDSFSVLPACDKSMNCCKGRFNNLAHYRGYPFIPVPETAY